MKTLHMYGKLMGYTVTIYIVYQFNMIWAWVCLKTIGFPLKWGCSCGTLSDQPSNLVVSLFKSNVYMYGLSEKLAKLMLQWICNLPLAKQNWGCLQSENLGFDTTKVQIQKLSLTQSICMKSNAIVQSLKVSYNDMIDMIDMILPWRPSVLDLMWRARGQQKGCLGKALRCIDQEAHFARVPP